MYLNTSYKKDTYSILKSPYIIRKKYMQKIYNYIVQLLLILGLTSSLTFNTIYNVKTIFIWIFISSTLLIASFFQKGTKAFNNYLFIGFITTSIISLLASQTKNIGLTEITLEITALSLLVVLSQYKKLSLVKFKLFFNFVILASTTQAIIAITQFFTRPEPRSAGSFLSIYNNIEYFPNALGMFFLLTIPILIRIKSRYLLGLIFCLNSLGLLLTFSRGALIAFAFQVIAISMYFIITRKNKKLVTILTSLVLSFIIFNTLNHLNTNPQKINISDKYTFQGTEKLTSVGERAQFFAGSLQLIKENPLLGTGPDSFSQVYPSIQPVFLANAPHPHNIFLKIGAERGVITLTLFILLILSILIKIARKKEISLKQTNFLILISISGGFLHNLIDFNLNFSSNLALMAILLGILISQISKSTSSRNLISKTILIALLISTSSVFVFKEVKLKLATENYTTNSKIAAKLLQNLNYKNSNYLLFDLQSIQADKEATLQNQVKINKFDSIASLKLASIQSDKELQKKYYLKALSLDPKNNWINYTNYYNLNTQEEIIKDKVKIKEELSLYLNLAKQNIHYTAQQDNIVQAQNLAETFYQATLDLDFKNIKEDLILAQQIFSSQD
jgi:O-antigen ligase